MNLNGSLGMAKMQIVQMDDNDREKEAAKPVPLIEADQMATAPMAKGPLAAKVTHDAKREPHSVVHRYAHHCFLQPRYRLFLHDH